jgi:anti-sigma B factor antagonist
MDIKEADRATVVDLAGDLVFGPECQALALTIGKLLDTDKNAILINLRQLRYIDSSGVGELIASLTTVKKKGGQLKIAEPISMVNDVFQLTRVNKVLEIYGTQEEALARFA